MSVNVSPRQLADPSFPSIVSEALMRAAVEPRSLWLEITESVMMENVESSIATLHALKALGVRLAIDDFGMGYSSLSYLQRFPIDNLKIDRAFIAATREEENTKLLRAIIDLAEIFGLRPIAEGVERPRQPELLLELGCELGQGFYFSRPVPAEEIVAIHRRSSLRVVEDGTAP